MIIQYDTRPDADVDQKLKSLIESIQLALGEIGIEGGAYQASQKKDLDLLVNTLRALNETISGIEDDISTLIATVAKQNTKIPFGEVDSTSTATAFTVQIPEITELVDGVCMYVMNGVVTSAANCTLQVNDLPAKPIYSSMAAASRSSTIFNINYTMLFIYNSTRVEGGCWDVFYGYDSNTNTIGYQVRTNSMSLPMSSKVYRYRLLFTSANGTHFVPANNSSSTNATSSRTVTQEKIDPFGTIRYYGTTASVDANVNPSAAALWQQYVFTLGYSFNRTGAALTLTHWKPVYIKCAPQTDGSAIIDPDNPFVQDLPTTEDGKIYIYLGVATSATAVELTMNHPVYEYKSGAVRQYTNAA